MIVRTDDSGASLLEFALVAPLLIFFAMATIEVGTYMYDGIEVANAARAGVQYATGTSASAPVPTYTDTPNIIAAAVADAKNVTLTKPTASDVTIYYTCSSTPTAESSTPLMIPPCTASTEHINMFVKVIAAGTFTSFMTFPGIPSTLTITRTAIGQVSP